MFGFRGTGRNRKCVLGHALPATGPEGRELPLRMVQQQPGERKEPGEEEEVEPEIVVESPVPGDEQVANVPPASFRICARASLQVHTPARHTSARPQEGAAFQCAARPSRLPTNKVRSVSGTSSDTQWRRLELATPSRAWSYRGAQCCAVLASCGGKRRLQTTRADEL